MGHEAAHFFAEKPFCPVLLAARGLCYEDLVAARFLLGTLGAAHPLGHDLGQLVRIDRQAGGDKGWRLDDILLTFVERVLAGSASPGFQTPATAFGAELVTDKKDDAAKWQKEWEAVKAAAKAPAQP